MDLPRQIRTDDPYPLRALVAFGLNHRMFPAPDRFLEAIQELDFICDVDLFATDSSRYADIVRPPAARWSAASCAATRRVDRPDRAGDRSAR